MCITYSPSLTIPLTRSCINRCTYCGYRRNDVGLIPMTLIYETIRSAHQGKISEILLISGEKPDKIHQVRTDLNSLGMDSFVSWTRCICEYLLAQKLLPHINIGPLDKNSLATLSEVVASMGLMLEGVNPTVNSKIHPGKDLDERISTIEAAGELKIPFTTGILMGTGESQKDRLDSILTLGEIQNKFGHIQEIILQRYVPNKHSCLPAHEILLKDIVGLIEFCKIKLPNVSIQIPPNLETNWEKLILEGINDLGGIDSCGDQINPERPWPDIRTISKKLNKIGMKLKKRLPIYPEYYYNKFFSEKVGKVISYWIEGCDEYKYYSIGSFSR